MEPLKKLPSDFSNHWMAQLHRPTADQMAEAGHYYLVAIRRTNPQSFEENRIIVLVVDENGYTIPGVLVAFSYSTAHQYLVDDNFKWLPPSPYRADIFPTVGGGQIEHIQGSTVKPGQPGGITTYIVEPQYSSDWVSGLGALHDHTGVHLVFQRRRAGVMSLEDRVKRLEDLVL